MQTFLNLTEFGMDIQRAIEEPRWTTRSFPASPFPHTMYPADLGVESRIPGSVRQALLRKQHKIRVHSAWSLGSNAVIVFDARTGVFHVGADPRANAYATAW